MCEFKLNVPKGALGERVLPVLRGFEAGILSALFIGPVPTIIEASGDGKRFSLQLKVIFQRREAPRFAFLATICCLKVCFHLLCPILSWKVWVLTERLERCCRYDDSGQEDQNVIEFPES